MKLIDINLDHFKLKLEEKKSGFTPGLISVKSISQFSHLYNNVNLDYTYKTVLSLPTDKDKNIETSKINYQQEKSIRCSILANINKSASIVTSPQNKSRELRPFRIEESDLKRKEETLDEIFSDDFDFGEPVQPLIAHESNLNEDEFDFSELDDPLTISSNDDEIPMLNDFVEIPKMEAIIDVTTDTLIIQLLASHAALDNIKKKAVEMTALIAIMEKEHESITLRISSLETNLLAAIKLKSQTQ